MNYHYLEIDSNYSQDNTCVYDFLLKSYKPYLKSLTIDKLMKIFEEDDKHNGVSTRQVEAFCIEFNISLYALDLEMKVFHRYTPIKRNHKVPSLVFVVGSKHMYPVLNESLRKSIFAAERIRESSFSYGGVRRTKSVQFDNKRPTIVNPSFEQVRGLADVNVVFTNLESLLPLVLYLFKEERTIYETSGYAGNILRIRYKNNVDIQVNQDYGEAKENCLSLNLVFKNQNLIHLVNEAFEVYRQTDRVQSTFNRVTREVFFNHIKRPFDHTFAVPSPNGNLKAFDIQKCHSACLSIQNSRPWSVYCIFDEVKPYSGKLKTGFFYIETDNYFPLRGNGWYSRAILEYSRGQGIEFSIKYEIIPSQTLPPDYFNDFVTRIYEKCSSPKKMMNCFIGCLNKKAIRKQSDRFTCDLNDAVRYYFRDDSSVYFTYPECPELYHIATEKVTELNGNSIPIYWQVIDNSNILLHKLAMQMKGKLIKLKTDCVVVQDGKNVECDVGIGKYRIERIPEEFIKSPRFVNDEYSFDLKQYPWQVETSPLVGKLLCGRAGTGKSYQVKQDLSALDRYAITATTNKAASLLGGQTIHKLLGIDEASFNIKSAIKIASKYQYIIIDEVSMMPANIYEVLYEIKMRTQVKFIFVGDYDQLPPVEAKSFDYFNSLALKELVDFNVHQLTENKRSDREMWNLFERIADLTPIDFGDSLNTRIHLCFTNIKRKQVNDIMMNKDKLKKKRMLFIEKNPEDANSQDVHLIVGAPVIAIRNNKQIGIVNGETFIVKSLNPLTVSSKAAGKSVGLTSSQFRDNFYINYCSTIHKCQGETYNESFTIHEWNRMSTKMKYTAISRATRKSLINIVNEDDNYDNDRNLPDTDYKKVKNQLKRARREEDPLFKRRKVALNIINKIVREGNVTDEYCLKHTLKTRVDLLEYLGIENEKIPRGYEIDHIKLRHEHVTQQDFEVINAYWNLRILSRQDNNARNWNE